MKDYYKLYRSTKFILAIIIALFFCNTVALAKTSNRSTNSNINKHPQEGLQNNSGQNTKHN